MHGLCMWGGTFEHASLALNVLTFGANIQSTVELTLVLWMPKVLAFTLPCTMREAVCLLH